MIAVTTSVVVLAAAVIVLFGAMAAMSLGVPTITVTRRRRVVTFQPRGAVGAGGATPAPAPTPARNSTPVPPAIPHAIPIDVRSHRVVTGRPARLPDDPTAALAPIPVGPTRPPAPAPSPEAVEAAQRAELRAAIDLVERLIEHQPERLAELITLWINDESS